jgi:hypothetical protein
MASETHMRPGGAQAGEEIRGGAEAQRRDGKTEGSKLLDKNALGTGIVWGDGGAGKQRAGQRQGVGGEHGAWLRRHRGKCQMEGRHGAHGLDG